MLANGDLLYHDGLIGYLQADGSYDFTEISYVKPWLNEWFGLGIFEELSIPDYPLPGYHSV